MKKLRWGLIGAGDIAKKRIAPALRDLENYFKFQIENRIKIFIGQKSFIRKF